jgi:hypothetical protein
LGIFTFFGAVDLRPGMDLVRWMSDSLAASTHLILFWSTNSQRSKWVEQEWTTKFWEYVQEGGKAIIPVILDGTPLPTFLKKVLFLDAQKGESDVIRGSRKPFCQNRILRKVGEVGCERFRVTMRPYPRRQRLVRELRNSAART